MNFWDPWGLLSRLLSRSKIHFPSIVPHSTFSSTSVMLKGLCIPSRVLWPRGTGPNAANEEMSQLEPTQLFHVFLHCYGTAWTDIVLCSDNLTSCSLGKVEGRAVYLEVCFPAFHAEDMWVDKGKKSGNGRNGLSISMSKDSCDECWRYPRRSYPVLSPLGG